jgi:superfamily I DNA/RNA helicase/DNA polymerase III epsilon subunit-like protein
MVELSSDQQRIVDCPPDGGHLLVLAGPGSGKTLVVCERIGHLLRQGWAAPDQILPLAFTQRAGAELQTRIATAGYPGVEAGTIHRFCAGLLDRYGTVIGIRPPLRIADVPRQLEALRRAAAETFGRPLDDKVLGQVGTAISRRKRTGADIWDAWRGEPFPGKAMRALDEAYCRILADDRALDFDDLISGAIRLLNEDEPTAEIVRNRYRYLFVDEFHDLSPEQFELLRLLAPARAPDRQVMAVADPHQAIFGFRGADAIAMIDRYTREYDPRFHRLTANFRSDETIVRTAGHLLPKDGAAVVNVGGQEVTCFGCESEEAEAAGLAGWIERARAAGYAYDDMAILYRTNARANGVEQTLLQRGIPLRRVQHNRFFNRPDVQEALRYLDLIAAMHDEGFVPALNWPRVIVDEPTMIALRRLANEVGMPLAELAARPDLLRGQVSPLTRVAVEEFTTTVAAELLPLADRPIDQISDRLLAILSRRRDPIPRARRADVLDILDFLRGRIEPFAEALDAVLRAGRPVAVIPGGDLDCGAGAVILRWVCERYLDQPIVEGVPPDDAFVIRLGMNEAPTADRFGIGIWATRTVTIGVAAQAWRLGQMVLMRREPEQIGRHVVLDLETTSTHAHTTEVLEVAAVRVDPASGAREQFVSLVRPYDRSALTETGEALHGLTWAHLRDAPLPGEVLPDLLAFLGDDTIVGHYAGAFDVQIVRRLAREFGLAVPTNHVLDTCLLAKRLLPEEAHGLRNLAARFGAGEVQTHRAAADAALTVDVLDGLLAELRRDKELGALTEALPLVALGTLAAGLPLTADNALLTAIGARAVRFGHGVELLDCLRKEQGATAIAAALAALAASDGAVTPDDAAWDDLISRWQEVVAGYCRTAQDRTLTAFLHFAALADAADLLGDDGGRVTMMTMHSAKGDEWPLVFLIGLEDGHLPDWRAATRAAIEEERRVLYVGMTRAKRRLCLSWAARINGHRKVRSRFLAELSNGLVAHRGRRP